MSCLCKAIKKDIHLRATGEEGVVQGEICRLCIMSMCRGVETECHKEMIFHSSCIGGVITAKEEVAVPANYDVIIGIEKSLKSKKQLRNEY